MSKDEEYKVRSVHCEHKASQATREDMPAGYTRIAHVWAGLCLGRIGAQHRTPPETLQFHGASELRYHAFLEPPKGGTPNTAASVIVRRVLIAVRFRVGAWSFLNDPEWTELWRDDRS